MKYVAIFLIVIMANYITQGFNEFLSREQPASLPSQVDPLQFENLTASISGEKIGSEMDGQFVGTGINAGNITTGFMKFDRAKGGELILGGEGNQNGVFSLRDGENNERLALNKDGMTINKGSIVINDENNNTVLDAQGLVSTVAFSSDHLSDTTDRSTTSNAPVTIANTSLNFNLTRTTKVLLLASLDIFVDSITDKAVKMINVIWNIDGTTPTLGNFEGARIYTADGSNTQLYPSTNLVSLSDQKIVTLNPGSHTVKLQFYIVTGSGDGTLHTTRTDITRIILGK